jgi:hypothetical protein
MSDEAGILIDRLHLIRADLAEIWAVSRLW